MNLPVKKHRCARGEKENRAEISDIEQWVRKKLLFAITEACVIAKLATACSRAARVINFIAPLPFLLCSKANLSINLDIHLFAHPSK